MRRALLVTCLVLSASAAATAQDLVDANHRDQLLEIAQSIGEARLDTTQPDGTLIAGSVEGVGYHLFLLNCDAAGLCRDINFYSGFKDNKPTLDAMNAWNRTHRFGRAYLDADLDAAIDYDVNIEGGVSAENLASSFRLWASLLGEFSAYVGFTE